MSASNLDKNDPLHPDNLHAQQQQSPDVKSKGEDVPPPDIRSEMALDAIKRNRTLAPMLVKPTLTAYAEAIAMLEGKTVNILGPLVNQQREAVRNGFPMSDAVFLALEKELARRIQDGFAGCSREDLHMMLCSVLQGLWLDHLKSVN